jgi:hypothetical protein
VRIVLKSGGLKLLESSGPVQGCNGISLPFYKFILISIDTSYQRGGGGGFFLAIFLSFFLYDNEVQILRPNIRAGFLFELWEHRDIKSGFGVCRPRYFLSKILDRTHFIIPKRSVWI